MRYPAQRFLWLLVLAGAVNIGSFSVPSSAVGQELEGLRGSAANAIEAQIRSTNLRNPHVSTFYGDLTGRGTNDAISFVYHDSGGSADQLVTWIWHEAYGAYTLVQTVPIDQVFGLDPRNIIFSPGRITVTMTVPQGIDPHCCPTGVREFSLEIGVGAVLEKRPTAAAHSRDNWIATTRTTPAMVGATGTASDGRTTFSVGCNPLMGKGVMGSLYGYGGEALHRIDGQSEAVTFNVSEGDGEVSFAGQIHYFAADEAWVITGSLPNDFLDAFARGDTLTIRNDADEEVATLDLGGSSKAARIMRGGCGM